MIYIFLRINIENHIVIIIMFLIFQIIIHLIFNIIFYIIDGIILHNVKCIINFILKERERRSLKWRLAKNKHMQ